MLDYPEEEYCSTHHLACGPEARLSARQDLDPATSPALSEVTGSTWPWTGSELSAETADVAVVESREEWT